MPANFGKVSPEQTPEEREAQAKEEQEAFAPGGKLADAFKAPPPNVPNPPPVTLPTLGADEQGYAKAFGGGSPPPPTAPRAQLAHQLGKAFQQPQPDTETPALQKAMSPTPPKVPPVQLAPTPSGGSRPVFNLPKGLGQVPATATMFLFIGLALVVMWRTTVSPLLDRATTGNKTPITMPSSSMLSLLLFGVLLIFVSELSPQAASFTALLMLGLWAVFLIMNPQVVTTFASWVSQGNQQASQAATAQQSQAKQQTGKKGA